MSDQTPEKQLVGVLEFPDAWLDGREWLFVEVVLTGVRESDGADIVVAGGVLDDGTNLMGMIYPGGQRLIRATPDNDWAIEEHFEGDPLQDSPTTRVWRIVVESWRRGMVEARAEERRRFRLR